MYTTRIQRSTNERMSYLSLCELLSEFLHFLPELAGDPGIGVLIDHGMVNNALGPICVAQRGQCLVVVIGGRTHSCYHGCTTVSSQAILKNKGSGRGERGEEEENREGEQKKRRWVSSVKYRTFERGILVRNLKTVYNGIRKKGCIQIKMSIFTYRFRLKNIWRWVEG